MAIRAMLLASPLGLIPDLKPQEPRRYADKETLCCRIPSNDPIPEHTLLTCLRSLRYYVPSFVIESDDPAIEERDR
jgi:hypothetical protein